VLSYPECVCGLMCPHVCADVSYPTLVSGDVSNLACVCMLMCSCAEVSNLSLFIHCPNAMIPSLVGPFVTQIKNCVMVGWFMASKCENNMQVHINGMFT